VTRATGGAEKDPLAAADPAAERDPLAATDPAAERDPLAATDPALGALLPGGALFRDKKGRPRELPRPLAPLADTHGHLTHFDGLDASVAVARAALAGVRLLVCPLDPADDAADARATLDWLDGVVAGAGDLLARARELGVAPAAPEGWEGVADLTSSVRVVAGVHPYGAERLAEARPALEVLLESDRCVGVGEVGLDYGPYNEAPREAQLAAFEWQLRLAEERDLPVELHIRDAAGDASATAHADAARVLERVGVPRRGCDLHCFTQGPEVMAPFVELGCHVAFGGVSTFRRSDEVRAAAAACPSGLILSETDSPYMAPVPLRGLECEPAMVGFSAACVAEAREAAGAASREETYAALWGNACALFGHQPGRAC
jgi:TatD DNase family protein